MELSEIDTFIAVAQAESFSRAAEILGYSQSAVTVRIKNLEEELGVRLFDRLGKGISLTMQGQIFYRHAIEIHKRVKEVIPALFPDRAPMGFLRIGTIDSLCTSEFPGIVRGFHERYPGIRMELMTDTPNGLFEKLKNNHLDIIYILDERVERSWIHKVFEAEEPILLAGAPDHVLADGQAHSLEEILTYPLILTEKDANYRRALEAELRRKNLEIMPVFSTNNTDILLKIVKGGMGITYLPGYNLYPEVKNGSMAEVIAKDLDVHMYRQVIYHKDKWLNREMKAFIEYLRETVFERAM